MKSTATYNDYAWLTSDEFAVWQEVGYCFTIITDATPIEVITLLEAQHTSTAIGVDDLHIRAGEAWDARGGGPFGKMLVAATAIDNTTLLVESTGFNGVTSQRMEPLSRWSASCVVLLRGGVEPILRRSLPSRAGPRWGLSPCGRQGWSDQKRTSPGRRGTKGKCHAHARLRSNSRCFGPSIGAA